MINLQKNFANHLSSIFLSQLINLLHLTSQKHPQYVIHFEHLNCLNL